MSDFNPMFRKREAPVFKRIEVVVDNGEEEGELPEDDIEPVIPNNLSSNLTEEDWKALDFHKYSEDLVITLSEIKERRFGK